MNAITPIPTDYAGCRFRSRLEARWAVFFDKLHIAWEYEPQGFVIEPSGRRYLPDFHLPEIGVWVEVKGDRKALDLAMLADAAAGPCKFLLMLGPIPRIKAQIAPTHSLLMEVSAFDMRPNRRTCAWADQLSAATRGLDEADRKVVDQAVWSDSENVVFTRAIFCGQSIMPVGLPMVQKGEDPLSAVNSHLPVVISKPIRDAYVAARSARFEHGESG